MEHFNSVNAALLVKAAIDANSIKLNGPGGTEAYSKENALRDATYLLTLYNALTGKPSAG